MLISGRNFSAYLVGRVEIVIAESATNMIVKAGDQILTVENQILDVNRYDGPGAQHV